jgi:hypothetical protein
MVEVTYEDGRGSHPFCLTLLLSNKRERSFWIFDDCKVDDLTGHRPRKTITVHGELQGRFSVERTVESVEGEEIFPFARFGLEIDFTLV